MVYFALPLFALICGSLATAPVENASELQLLHAEPSPSGFDSYHIYGKANYFMANEVCQGNNMRLVRINDQNKNDEVTHFIGKLTAISGPYWTLANRMYDDTTWAFAVGDPVKYFNWARGEPNNARGNERCIEIYRNGEWNDQDCGDERFVLCERIH